MAAQCFTCGSPHVTGMCATCRFATYCDAACAEHDVVEQRHDLACAYYAALPVSDSLGYPAHLDSARKLNAFAKFTRARGTNVDGAEGPPLPDGRFDDLLDVMWDSALTAAQRAGWERDAFDDAHIPIINKDFKHTYPNDTLMKQIWRNFTGDERAVYMGPPTDSTSTASHTLAVQYHIAHRTPSHPILWPTPTESVNPVIAVNRHALEEALRVRVRQRQKQIAFGKRTKGYAAYTEHVERTARAPHHPRTPDPYSAASKKAWDAECQAWRRKLHQWDPPDVREIHRSQYLHRSNTSSSSSTSTSTSTDLSDLQLDEIDDELVKLGDAAPKTKSSTTDLSSYTQEEIERELAYLRAKEEMQKPASLPWWWD